MANVKLWEAFAEFKKTCRLVDLTRIMDENTPHYSGFPTLEKKMLYDFENTNCNFRSHVYTTVGQYCTHVDPPVHFVKDGRSLEAFTPDDMIMPLCVFDLSKEVAANPDYCLTVKDIEAWEAVNGRVPEGSFCAFRSDWYKRQTSEEMFNAGADGRARFPGWTVEALKFLAHERKVAALGHETTDTDPPVISSVEGWIGEKYWLEQDKYQIELLAHLDECPAKGAMIFCTFPRVKDASGFPARCFALVPNE